MSRFSSSSSKIGRFVARNEGRLISGFVREAAAKGMHRSLIRNIVSNIVPVRHPDRWLFIVGCYNSGTTILRKVLESHPQIAGLPHEGVQMTDAFPDLEAGGWPRMMYSNRDSWNIPDTGSPEIVKKAMRDWSLWWPRGADVFLEKSIDHTTRIGWTSTYFPNSCFVAITRNGYCVCEGIRRRASPVGNARMKVGTSYPIELLGKQWAAFDDELVGALAKTPNSMAMKYEDFISNPIDNIEKIFDLVKVERVSLEFNDRVLDVNGIKHELLNQNQVSLSRLSAEDKRELTPIIRKSLLRNDYEVLSE